MQKIVNFYKRTLKVTTDEKALDMEKIYDLLSKSYWANNRPKKIILRSIENALNFSLLEGEQQIGFGRVITDYATFAYLCDVIVDEDYRGQGLGKWLIECMLNHPELKDVRWSLMKKDAQDLYRKFGFEILKHTGNSMMRLKQS